MKLFNLTDHPKHVSSVINIYNGHIFPGQSISIDDNLVTDKVLALGDMISINEQPVWYLNWKYPSPKFTYEPPVEALVEVPEEKKKSGRK